MIARRLGILCGLAICACAGCVSLSLEERQRLSDLNGKGCSLESPPAKFSPPTNDKTAAGLNLLPGIGNFYLAEKGDNGGQWAVGVGNLLLWPISILWAVPEAYVDARALNKRALLAFSDAHPAITNTPFIPPPVTNTVVTNVADTKLWKVSSLKNEGDGRYTARVKILDRSKLFSILPDVERKLEIIARGDYMRNHPDISENDVRISFTNDTDEDGTVLVLHANPSSVRPVKVGWSYDASTNKGVVRLRIPASMSVDEAKGWARDNISSIVVDKNVNISSGDPLPPGATYKSLSERCEDGVLTVEFAAVN